jgi:hypothetical protein
MGRAGMPEFLLFLEDGTAWFKLGYHSGDPSRTRQRGGVQLGEDGQLRLLKVNPRQYEEVSRLEPQPGRKFQEDAASLLEYQCWAAPILAHGLLYVRGKDRLVWLELIPVR